MKNKPSFVSQKIFSKHFVAIHEIKRVLTLDKPIHVRFSVRDPSKLLMYELNYKYNKRKYNTKFCLHTKTVYFIKLKQMMFTKILMKIKVCLILVINQKTQRFLILSLKN